MSPRKKLTKSQVRSRTLRMLRKAEAPIEDEYHHDPRIAAWANDNKARVARGEEPLERPE